MVSEVMSGQYRTQFRGQGMTFSEHRVYMPGDDVRHIDWKVSARTRDPMIKKYEEERELTVFLVVDISGSGLFGSSRKLKSEATAEIGGMLAYAAAHAGDKVGVLLFSGQVEKIIPPKKGRQHILRIIREILTRRPESPGTNLRGALDAAGKIMKHSGIVFVLSDFIADDYEFSLKKLARKHDVTAISVGDRRESKIPEVGQILFVNPESGEENLIDTGSYAFKKWFDEYQSSLDKKTREILRSGRVELLRILTQEDYAEAVVRFFRKRAKKKR